MISISDKVKNSAFFASLIAKKVYTAIGSS